VSTLKSEEKQIRGGVAVLKSMGFKGYKERREWLNAHKREIEEYLTTHSLVETMKHFHVGYDSLKKLGIIRLKKGRLPKEASSLESLLERLPPDADVGTLLARGFINLINSLREENERLKKRISELEKELAKPKETKITAEELKRAISGERSQ